MQVQARSKQRAAVSNFKVKDRCCAPKAHLQACKVGRMFGRLVKRQSAKARPRHVGLSHIAQGRTYDIGLPTLRPAVPAVHLLADGRNWQLRPLRPGRPRVWMQAARRRQSVLQ